MIARWPTSTHKSRYGYLHPTLQKRTQIACNQLPKQWLLTYTMRTSSKHYTADCVVKALIPVRYCTLKFECVTARNSIDVWGLRSFFSIHLYTSLVHLTPSLNLVKKFPELAFEIIGYQANMTHVERGTRTTPQRKDDVWANIYRQET